MKRFIIITGISLLASPLFGQLLSEKVENVNIEPAENDSLPAISELKEGWNTLRPGGETICAQGSEYLFFTRVADPTKLVVYLHGGGGCWDAETCDPERDASTYASKVEPQRHPGELSGIFDLDHPENPVADYSMVVLPVCTGDAFLGDRDIKYTLNTESGENRDFIIHHRGQTNTMAVINWIYDNFKAPKEIFIAGSSAGAIAMPFYASLLSRHYPEARIYGLGDDSGSYGAPVANGTNPGSWGIPEVLQPHSGWEQFGTDFGIEHLYVNAVQNAPNLKLYQVDHANDKAQRFYLQLADLKDLDVSAHLRANRNFIRERVPNFRSFTMGGYEHTVLTRETFYYYQENGHRLRDWLAKIVAGEPVPSVDCGDDCQQQGLIYSAEDIRIIEKAIELLSAPAAWNSQDALGSCASEADNYSIRCAMVKATEEVTGRTPRGRQNVPPVLLDLVFTITARSQGQQPGNVLITYNNDPKTSAEDMISMLEVVRKRIQKDLEMKR